MNRAVMNRAVMNRAVMNRAVMNRAWKIARLATSLYGGKPIDYFDTALRRSWGCQRDAIAWWNN